MIASRLLPTYLLLHVAAQPPPLQLLFISLSAQPVKADGRPPRAWLCLRFLPVRTEIFLAAVAKCVLMVGMLVLKEHGLNLSHFLL